MHKYHVEIHGNAVLEIELTGVPVTFRLTSLDSGEQLTFPFDGNTAKVAATTIAAVPSIERPPTTYTTRLGKHLVRQQVGTGATTFDYIDPQGSSMP